MNTTANKITITRVALIPVFLVLAVAAAVSLAFALVVVRISNRSG